MNGKARSAKWGRSCAGYPHVRTEHIRKLGDFYRCFAEGPRMGRSVSDGAGRFLPYVPVWCPLMLEKEADDGDGKQQCDYRVNK